MGGHSREPMETHMSRVAHNSIEESRWGGGSEVVSHIEAKGNKTVTRVSKVEVPLKAQKAQSSNQMLRWLSRNFHNFKSGKISEGGDLWPRKTLLFKCKYKNT